MAYIDNPQLTSSASTNDVVPTVETEHISELYFQRNSLPPIFRLPAELLIAIFIHCAQVDCKWACGFATSPGWVNVSYVCHHWRKVTLNCSTLWSHLCVVSGRWIDELLARSKQAPLKLYVYLGPDTSFLKHSHALNNLKQVMNHVERIRVLHLIRLSRRRDLRIFPELCSRAPCLQNLTIRMDPDIKSSKWYSVPFNGDTPSFCELELSNCPVPWYLFKLERVTKLILDCIPVRFRQNMTEFLTTLGSMQNLTHLELWLGCNLPGVTNFHSGAAVHRFQKINLSRLSHLLITAEFQTLITLLSCIHIPTNTQVRLEQTDQSHSGNHSPLTSILQQRLNSLENMAGSCAAIRSLLVRFTSDCQHIRFPPSLTAGTSEHILLPHLVPPSYMHIPWTDNIFLHIQLMWLINMPDENRVFYDVCTSVSSTTVESLHIVDPPFSSAFWRWILGHLPNLRRLMLSSGTMPDIASVLAEAVLVPALEELKLHCVKFSATSLEDAVDVQRLCDALSSRKESRGQLTIVGRSTMRLLVGFDMVGTWGDGHFHIVSHSTVP